MKLDWYTKIFVLETSIMFNQDAGTNQVVLVWLDPRSVDSILQQSFCWCCEFLGVDGQNLGVKVSQGLPSKRLFDWTPADKMETKDIEWLEHLKSFHCSGLGAVSVRILMVWIWKAPSH